MQASSSAVGGAVADELRVAELVQHRHQRDRDQVRVVAGAEALALSLFHHRGDQSDR